MEPSEQDETLPPWVLLEYQHICQQILARPTNKVLFTNLSQPLAQALTTHLKDYPGASCLTQGIQSLIQDGTLTADRVCLLDPRAPNPLAPVDATAFDVFLFGGILGDDPPRDRTGELRKLNYAGRHLGSVQMTTDTAATVTQRVLETQVPLDQLEYLDHPTLQFNKHESTTMPFRYLTQDGQPLMAPGMRQLIHEDMDKAFDF